METVTKLLDRNLDRGLAFAVLTCLVIGIAAIHSASKGENIESSDFWIRQAMWALVSVAVIAGMIHIPVRYIYAFAYVFYGAVFLSLVAVEIFGSAGGGAERWLRMGPVRFQPSEFLKVAVILALARYLSFKKNRPSGYLQSLVPGLFVIVPLGFVLRQPDLGTSLILFALIFPMLYWAGLDIRRLFFLVAPILSAVFAAPFIPWFNWVTWTVFMFFILGLLYFSRYSFVGMGAVLGTNILRESRPPSPSPT